MDDSGNLLWYVPATVAVLLVSRWIFQRRKMDGPTKKPLYRVDHSVLNIPLPLQSMWMNMGYWKDTEDFPTACRALLEKVLRNARIISDQGLDNTKNNEIGSLSILDLGFGCGDQCLYIRDTLARSSQDETADLRSKRLKAYVGLTLEESHFQIAQKRLDDPKLLAKDATFKIFCADAAKPASWALATQNAISHANQADQGAQHHETWVLGLDTLYHFQPSRWPVIEHASKNLGASVMAFDLCTADTLTRWQRIVIKLLAVFGQSPSANWLTISEYRERLVDAGYEREKIEIQDISEHVFGPLHAFMKRREIELEQHGMSIGRYRHAAKMFGWWHRTGAVRGCIVVARK